MQFKSKESYLTQNRKRELGPRQKDLGPHGREKLCEVGTEDKGPDLP